jgi:hypothetical protein
VLQQSALEIAFLCLSSEGEEIEVVRVLDEQLSEIRLGGRECCTEVCDGLALAPIETALNLEDKDIPAPAVRMVCWMYQVRSSVSFTLSSRTQLWN